MRGRQVCVCVCVVVIAACGSTRESEPATGQLEHCITTSDGYATCDEYCASVSASACIDNFMVGMDPAPGDGCAVSIGSTNTLWRSGAYVGWTRDSTCTTNRSGFVGGADTVSSSCDRAAFEASSFGPPPVAIRCCCGL